jgi:multimeric flavodoxin WrbA
MSGILCIGGSPRAGGNSDILMEQFIKGVTCRDFAAEAIQLRDYRFQSCKGCEKCRKDGSCTGIQDDMQLVYPKIIASSGLILVSPVHNYNITAIMKSFIDRLYCFYNFDGERPGEWSSRLANQGRKAVIAAIGEQVSYEDSGVLLALQAMRLPLEALGYQVIGELPVTGVFHKGKILQYPEILNQAERMGRQLKDDMTG